MANKSKKTSGPKAARLALDLKGISKSFGPVHANKDIDLSVEAGTIHGIIGENGAGKSTLMNILYGLHPADRGGMKVNGEELKINGSADAINAELIVFAPIFGGGPPHPSPPPIVARYLALR